MYVAFSVRRLAYGAVPDPERAHVAEKWGVAPGAAGEYSGRNQHRAGTDGVLAIEIATGDLARAARGRDRLAHGGGNDGGRLGADPLSRRAPRLADLPDPGAARRLAPRPGAGAGGGDRGRAVVGLFLLFAV